MPSTVLMTLIVNVLLLTPTVVEEWVLWFHMRKTWKGDMICPCQAAGVGWEWGWRMNRGDR